MAGDTATVCRLIEKKHSPCSREIDGSTPVQIAAEHGQLGEDLLASLTMGLGFQAPPPPPPPTNVPVCPIYFVTGMLLISV